MQFFDFRGSVPHQCAILVQQLDQIHSTSGRYSMILSRQPDGVIQDAFPVISIKHGHDFFPGKLWDSGLFDALIGTEAKLALGDVVTVVLETSGTVYVIPGVVHWVAHGSMLHKYGIALGQRTQQLIRACRRTGITRTRFACRRTGRILSRTGCMCPQATVVDYSRRGVSLETTAEFQVGETISFELSGTPTPFRMVVRWSKRNGRFNRLGCELDLFESRDYPVAEIDVRACLQKLPELSAASGQRIVNPMVRPVGFTYPPREGSAANRR